MSSTTTTEWRAESPQPDAVHRRGPVTDAPETQRHRGSIAVGPAERILAGAR